MKYAWLTCKENKKHPLPLYVTFNKYFYLEPLLTAKSHAIGLFRTWVLAKILLSTFEFFESANEIIPGNLLSSIPQKEELEKIISTLEQGLSPTDEQMELASSISSVTYVSKIIEQLASSLSRKRTIIFLDDAAISLTTEYLYEFFDIVRTLRTPKISPKASVYPGSTEYGPKFHVAHEAKVVSAWLDIQHTEYTAILGEVAAIRFNQINQVDKNIVEILKYASFGIPRSFLTMLRDFVSSKGNTNQQKFNQIISQFCSVRTSEYRSLTKKIPRLENIIDQGEVLFEKIIDEIKNANINSNDPSTKQIIFGLEEYSNSLAERMIELLIEVGFLYPLTPISHGKHPSTGKNRIYKRYIPHYAFLMNVKTFNKNSRGFNSEEILHTITQDNTKHPVRAKLENLIDINALQLNLPVCTSCTTPRNSNTQKFCGNCGSQLIDESTFYSCMQISLDEIPSFTHWQKGKLKELNIASVGEFLSLSDPGSKLRKIDQIGIKRAGNIIQKISLHVDEFLS